MHLWKDAKPHPYIRGWPVRIHSRKENFGGGEKSIEFAQWTGRDGVSLRGFKAYCRTRGQSSGLKNHLHQDITWLLLGDAAASRQSGCIN